MNLEFIHINDNPTNTTLPSGQDPRSIAVTVAGGNRLEIAERIFDTLPAGISAWGAIYETVADDAGYSHQVGISRPTEILVEVSVSIKVATGSISDTASLVQQALVVYINTLNIGEDLEWSSLFAPVLSIEGVTISALTTALQGGLHGTTPIVIGVTERAATINALVIITEV